MGCSDGMEPGDDEKKKLSDEFVDFVRKRSDTDTPRYTARLKTYVDIKRKRDRADAARRHYEGGHEKTHTAARRRPDEDQKDKAPESTEHTNGVKDRISRRSDSGETSEGSYRRVGGRGSSSSDAEPDPFCVEPFLATRLPGRLAMREGDKVMPRVRSASRSRSGEPSDRGCMRRRRRRRRRRSCGRRRRRRRSCGRRRRRRRRSCRRRRRRSCRRRRSRRRRRRSCSRRRRRCRRRR